MRKNKLARDQRRHRAFERFGTDTPRCAACGETDVRCLEAHHVAGRRYDPMTCVMCANCHRKVTDAQKDHPPPIPEGDAFLDTLGRFLLGLADMLREIIEKLTAFGEELVRRARPCATPEQGACA